MLVGQHFHTSWRRAGGRVTDNGEQNDLSCSCYERGEGWIESQMMSDVTAAINLQRRHRPTGRSFHKVQIQARIFWGKSESLILRITFISSVSWIKQTGRSDFSSCFTSQRKRAGGHMLKKPCWVYFLFFWLTWNSKPRLVLWQFLSQSQKIWSNLQIFKHLQKVYTSLAFFSQCIFSLLVLILKSRAFSARHFSLPRGKFANNFFHS